MILVLSIAFVTSLIFQQSSPTVADEVTVEPINIGSISILTGTGASWGVAAQQGMQLAIKDLNADGGVLGRPVAGIYEDSQSDPKVALSAFRKLVDSDNVDMIIGTTWSHTGLALVEPAKAAGTVMISPSLGKAAFNEASDKLFNTWPHDVLLSAELADHVYAEGHTRVAVFGLQQVWVEDQVNAFTSRFEALGGEIVYNAAPTDERDDSKSDVTKALAQNPDAVILMSALYPTGINAATTLQTFGSEMPLYSVSVDGATIEAANGVYDGMAFLTSLTPDQSFANRYARMYNEDIDIGVASAYDAVMMLAEAMESVGSTDTDLVATELNRLTSYTGVSGQLTADGQGGFTKASRLMQVTDGQAVTQ